MHESQNDFGDGMALFGADDLFYVPDDELDEFTDKFKSWKSYVHELLAAQFGCDDQFVNEWDTSVVSYVSKRKPILSQLRKNVNKGLSLIESFQQRLDIHSNYAGFCKEVLKQNQITKPHKVFISHKNEDKAYADALINMINFIIGADGDKIFCSSVPGYGIKQSHDIMDELKAQFENYEIFMIIIHSPRYYQSAVCLNEMGASWVMGTRFCSFLTTDCKTEHMRGVINKEKIFIDPNDDQDMLEAHLNDFKNDLAEFFGKGSIDENKWANARKRFVNEVSGMTYESMEKTDVDLFEKIYLPAFEQIFKILDIENFQQWAYPCAIGGNTYLKGYIYENLYKVPDYILSRPKHKEYASWDSLMHNLGLLVSDFENVFSQHAKKLDNDIYVVERFYKIFNPNPNYEEDLAAYNEHVMLVSDMLFEIARLCNLILSRIRVLYPDYKQELGILHIDSLITEPDLVYRETEISDTPYPGLKDYIKLRLTREKHLGSKANIDASGYESQVR